MSRSKSSITRNLFERLISGLNQKEKLILINSSQLTKTRYRSKYFSNMYKVLLLEVEDKDLDITILVNNEKTSEKDKDTI